MDDQTQGAVKAPLEAPVRPRAWAWKDEPSGIEVYSGWDEPRPTNGSEPLYDQAAIDAEVAAERERWRVALGACDAALAQCQPCADPACAATQREYIDTARAAAALLLRA